MTTEDHLTIYTADETDVHTIATLAHATWPQTYGDILSDQQLSYMLDLYYSAHALREQLADGHTFLIAEISSEPVGFASFSHDHTVGAYKIHKLYVHPMMQGNGIGKKLIEKVLENIGLRNASSLRLNVNRNNPAKIFYEKIGFSIVGEEDIAIGEGYFMNDYVMERKL